MRNIVVFLAACLIMLMGGCATMDRHYHATELAYKAGLIKSLMTVNGFVLTAYSRITDLNQHVNVYIEGDGLAWLTRYQRSADPTPKKAVGLMLAAADTAPNVVYLARPCQFNNFKETPCDSVYWANKRFSEEVINAINQELDTFMLKTHSQKVNLIGYSGGAAIAVLLASRRHDINSLRTVAGNLDHAYVNKVHHVDLMPQSLNAIDVAQKINNLPQLHFIGIDDTVIPKEVALRFIAYQQATHCAELIEVNAGHQDFWVEHWQSLLLHPLPC